MATEGGITEGKSHKEGGIPMVVKSTGQQVELEGGEGVINKRNMASTKTFNFEGKELTICEIASQINKTDGNGVEIDCSGVVGKKYKYNDGGMVRTLQKDDAVLYKGQLYYLTEKNGVIGIINLQSGAWGSDYPFIPLSRIDIDTELTDMSGNRINIIDEYEDVGQEFKNGGAVSVGTRHEMEHAETIEKIKRKNIPTEKVAELIAKDHIKENPKYYTYLRKLEKQMKKGISGHELHKTLSEHDRLLHKKHHRKRYVFGGDISKKENVQIVVKENYMPSLYDLRTGKYSGESLLRKYELQNLYFLDNDGRNSTFIYPQTDYYFTIPNNLIEIKGYSRRFSVGGGVPSYSHYINVLSELDIKILDVLRVVSIDKLTHQDLEFISNFRGMNVVNNLPIDLITKIFGLMFKYHSIEYPIHNILISNNGTGNLLNLAPTYVKNVFVDFVDNPFRQIEEQINFAQNRNKVKFFENNYKDIDAIIHVYPKMNPEQDELLKYRNANPRGIVGLGVCEFSNKEGLHEFKKEFVNDRIKEENVATYIVETGITKDAKCTLVYIFNRF